MSASTMPSASLPHVPSSLLDDSGVPRFGTYVGALALADVSSLIEGPGARLRALRRRRSVFALVSTPDVVVGSGIVDLGPIVQGFGWAVDVTARRVLAQGTALLPPGRLAEVNDVPDVGLHAQLRAGVAAFHIERPQGAERLTLSASALGVPLLRPGLDVRAELLIEGAPPPVTVIAPVSGGVVSVTQKRGGLLSFGRLRAGQVACSLDGGVGGSDYSQGILARQTSWNGAMALGRLADGTPVTLNVTQGFNDSSDDTHANALWLGPRLVPLGRARFNRHVSDVLERWRIITVDGSLELEFSPIWAYRQNHDWKLVKTQFVQPVGTFSGRVKVDGAWIALHRLGGVVEEQHALW